MIKKIIKKIARKPAKAHKPKAKPDPLPVEAGTAVDQDFEMPLEAPTAEHEQVKDEEPAAATVEQSEPLVKKHWWN
jgi:hypothetical protein